jgi:hypothetical protein
MENKELEKRTNLFFKISGDWGKQSTALRIKYPRLSSEDVKFETGNEIDLYKRLEAKLGINRNDVISVLKHNFKTCC